MSYKSLYRTYRPQTFKEVAGQKQIVKTLENAILNNKVAHAYLFTGPRGTGKTSMAKLLAKALNCTSEEKPCLECDNCKAIMDGSFPDVIEIDAASNNGVDEVRNLIDKVKYAPIEGKYKIYIIDEVHMMSQGAFNALLKTLEEPPEHVIFILATTEPHKVLPTIVSRCQRFDFGRISRYDIEERLRTILEKEEIEYEDGVIELVSELADGGMRDALSILDQTIAYAGNIVTLEDIRTIYGVVSNEEKIDFIKQLVNNDYQALLTKINDFEYRGVDISRFTSNLVDTIKEIVIYKNSGSFKGLKTINENNSYITKEFSNKRLFKMIDTFVEALSSYRKAGSVKALFEIACLKICELKDEEQQIIYKEVVKEVPVVNEEKAEPVEVKTPAPEADYKEEQEELAPSYIENETTGIKQVESSKEIIEEKNIESEKAESSDVSHETLEKNQKTPEIENLSEFENKISEEELLNVLVQASKDYLVKAKQQWVMLPKYLNSNTTAKVTSLLLDGVPVAACENVILIGYANDVYLKRIYSENNHEEMDSFLKALYNNDMKCYCITTDEFMTLKEKYMTLRQLGKLPKPIPIVIQHQTIVKPSAEENKESQNVEYAKKLFGDNVIIKED